MTEGSTTTAYTISANQTPTEDITIQLEYSGSAKPGLDFGIVNPVIMLSGNTQVQFTIDTYADPIAESMESFTVDFTEADGGGFDQVTNNGSNVTTTITNVGGGQPTTAAYIE